MWQKPYLSGLAARPVYAVTVDKGLFCHLPCCLLAGPLSPWWGAVMLLGLGVSVLASTCLKPGGARWGLLMAAQPLRGSAAPPASWLPLCDSVLS